MDYRAFVCLAVLGASCAGRQADKMAWPVAPPVPGSAPDPAAPARGGPLDSAPQPPARPLRRTDGSVARLPQVVAPVVADHLQLLWPLPTTGINSLYGMRPDPLDGSKRHHNGVDLDAVYGSVVQAAAEGIVITADWEGGHGRRVVIAHAGGYQTSYSHLSQILTSAGLSLRAGDPVGLVGNSGRSTGPHLHFEVSRWGSYVDPLEVLGVDLPLD